MIAARKVCSANGARKQDVAHKRNSLAQMNKDDMSGGVARCVEHLERLLSRNAGYGRAVQGSLEKRADLLQIHYAYALRTVGEKDAWTAADRKAYYEWFGRAREWAGGNSFRKFLTNIENESLAHLSDTERMALETLGVRQPYAPPPLPRPGPSGLGKGGGA